jgi:hypothetical protein
MSTSGLRAHHPVLAQGPLVEDTPQEDDGGAMLTMGEMSHQFYDQVRNVSWVSGNEQMDLGGKKTKHETDASRWRIW